MTVGADGLGRSVQQSRTKFTLKLITQKGTKDATEKTNKQYRRINCCHRSFKNANRENINELTIKSDSEYVIREITKEIEYLRLNHWKVKSTNTALKNKELQRQIEY